MRLSHYLIISPSHYLIISSYHHIIISSYHHIIISSYHHIITSSYQQPDFPEKRTHHFSNNLDKRPGESSIRKGFRYKSRDDRLNSSKSGMWIFLVFLVEILWNPKTSNVSKIAGIASTSTILGRFWSRRGDLSFPKFPGRRKKNRVDEKQFATTNKRTKSFLPRYPPTKLNGQ